jgi:hypothetical protein
MVLCLAGHHPVVSIGGNARRQGLKTTFALLCPRSPGLTPRSLFGYSIVDSLIIVSFHLLNWLEIYLARISAANLLPAMFQ